MSEVKKFTSTRRLQIVEIDGTKYILKEYSGPERDQYMAWQKKQVKIDDAGTVVDIVSFENQHGRLLELTLHEMDIDGVSPGKLVTQQFIKDMSASLQDFLYIEACVVCGITPAAAQEAKNS